MNENVISIQLEIKQPKVKEDLEEIISSMEDFQFQQSGNPSPCDVLILEIGEDPQKEFSLIHNIQDSGVIREIFLTSRSLDPTLLLQALRAGAKEFFSQPIKKDEVKSALLKFKERKEKTKFDGEKRKTGKIIDVVGGKGGVGNTTIAVNLATSLAETGTSPLVALIDMNLLFGEIPIFLNIESSFNWGEVARNISRLDSTYLMSILYKRSSGVYVLPSPDAGAAGGTLVNPDGSFQAGWNHFPTLVEEFLIASRLGEFVRKEYPTVPGGRAPRSVDWITSACLLVRRAALTQVGLLDESYFIYGEETDLQYRLVRDGSKVYHVPAATTIHFGGRSMDRWRRRKMVYRGKMLFFQQQYGATRTAMLRAMLAALTVGKLALWLLVWPVPSRRERSAREIASNVDVLHRSERGRAIWPRSRPHPFSRNARWRVERRFGAIRTPINARVRIKNPKLIGR